MGESAFIILRGSERPLSTLPSLMSYSAGSDPKQSAAAPLLSAWQYQTAWKRFHRPQAT